MAQKSFREDTESEESRVDLELAALHAEVFRVLRALTISHRYALSARDGALQAHLPAASLHAAESMVKNLAHWDAPASEG